MKESLRQKSRVDAYYDGPVPRDRACLCDRCGDEDAEHRIQWLIAGEKIPESLCTPCAARSLGWDLEGVPTPALRGGCEYVPDCVLDGLPGRQPRDYRASHLIPANA